MEIRLLICRKTNEVVKVNLILVKETKKNLSLYLFSCKLIFGNSVLF